MSIISRATVAIALVLALSACGTTAPTPAKTAEVTVIQPLSQMEWAEMISADHAAKVSNNSLIMMR